MTMPQQRINLASHRLGAKALSASDDFFAPKERLIQDPEPVFIDDKYDDNGKWMDGWESRRKRGAGHDHCIIQLCGPGIINGVDIDTRHFTGNYAPAVSIDACYAPDAAPNEGTTWTQILAPTSLQGDRQHLIDIASNEQQLGTHIRLNIYPDGGIARLRVYGAPHCDLANRNPDELIDLAAMLHGGRAILCNDEHFGRMQNLLLPGRGVNMGDGWETRRRREPGHDWVIIALGQVGTVKNIAIDTAHFKGNYPHQCSVQGAWMPGADDHTIAAQSLFWRELLPRQALRGNHLHHYTAELIDIGPITHARLDIFPDGGISRLRLNGLVELR